MQISESALARLHMLVRTDPSADVTVDVERIERRIAEALRTWERPAARGTARRACRTRRAALADASRRFPGRVPGRRVAPADAIDDIAGTAWRCPQTGTALGLRAAAGRPRHAGRCTCASTAAASPSPCRTSLPLLENFDLRILNERPYRIGAGARRVAVDPGPRGHARRRPRHSIRRRSGRASRQAFFAVLERPGRERRLQPARARGGPRLAPGRWCCAPCAATCCRPASRSASATWNRCSRGTRTIAARLAWTFEVALRPRR